MSKSNISDKEYVLNYFDNIEDKMNDLESLLNQNLKLGYIKENTTVDELLKFILNIKTNYLPVQRSVTEFIKKQSIRR